MFREPPKDADEFHTPQRSSVITQIKKDQASSAPSGRYRELATALEHNEIRLSCRRIGDRPFLPLPALREER
jgi:hypothetical protein